MNEINQDFLELGVSLTTLAVKGTASIVNTKIKNLKEEKNLEKMRTTYDELVNELILEREEAVRIAQAYKSEIDRIVISDSDIRHLNATFDQLIKIMNLGDSKDEKSFNVIKQLISVDTLKTMQLLGFNYRAAIGEPLTEICANAIKTSMKKSNP